MAAAATMTGALPPVLYSTALGNATYLATAAELDPYLRRRVQQATCPLWGEKGAGNGTRPALVAAALWNWVPTKDTCDTAAAATTLSCDACGANISVAFSSTSAASVASTTSGIEPMQNRLSQAVLLGSSAGGGDQAAGWAVDGAAIAQMAQGHSETCRHRPIPLGRRAVDVSTPSFEDVAAAGHAFTAGLASRLLPPRTTVVSPAVSGTRSFLRHLPSAEVESLAATVAPPGSKDDLLERCLSLARELDTTVVGRQLFALDDTPLNDGPTPSVVASALRLAVDGYVAVSPTMILRRGTGVYVTAPNSAANEGDASTNAAPRWPPLSSIATLPASSLATPLRLTANSTLEQVATVLRSAILSEGPGAGTSAAEHSWRTHSAAVAVRTAMPALPVSLKDAAGKALAAAATAGTVSLTPDDAARLRDAVAAGAAADTGSAQLLLGTEGEKVEVERTTTGGQSATTATTSREVDAYLKLRTAMINAAAAATASTSASDDEEEDANRRRTTQPLLLEEEASRLAAVAAGPAERPSAPKEDPLGVLGLLETTVPFLELAGISRDEHRALFPQANPQAFQAGYKRVVEGTQDWLKAMRAATTKPTPSAKPQVVAGKAASKAPPSLSTHPAKGPAGRGKLPASSGSSTTQPARPQPRPPNEGSGGGGGSVLGALPTAQLNPAAVPLVHVGAASTSVFGHQQQTNRPTTVSNPQEAVLQARASRFGGVSSAPAVVDTPPPPTPPAVNTASSKGAVLPAPKAPPSQTPGKGPKVQAAPPAPLAGAKAGKGARQQQQQQPILGTSSPGRGGRRGRGGRGGRGGG